MKAAYRVALWCGALPLVVGVSIFVLWVITRWDSLMLAGIFTLFGGLAFFAAGAIALSRFCWLGLRAPDLPRRRLWLRTIACGALLLSNFPVAGGIVVAADVIETCYTVVVRNGSASPLDDVRVVGGGCDVSFGSIPPGDAVRRHFWIQCDGHLELRAVGLPDHAIRGYVTNGQGCHTIVTVHPDGAVSAIDRD